MSARPTRTPSQEGQVPATTATADGGTAAVAAQAEDVVDVHIPVSLTRAGLYRLTVEIRNTDGQVCAAIMLHSPNYDCLRLATLA